MNDYYLRGRIISRDGLHLSLVRSRSSTIHTQAYKLVLGPRSINDEYLSFSPDLNNRPILRNFSKSDILVHLAYKKCTETIDAYRTELSHIARLLEEQKKAFEAEVLPEHPSAAVEAIDKDGENFDLLIRAALPISSNNATTRLSSTSG